MNHRIFWTTILWIILAIQGFSQVWTYDCPGGEEYKSPDYEVSVIQDGDTLESFVYYSFGLDEYISYNSRGEPLDPSSYNGSPDHNGPERHSASIFSFNNPVTVRIKINSGANNITLPLKSAKILPSSYNIPCEIKDGNIIEFVLDRPEKIAVIPNYDEVWDIYVQKGVGHIPIQNWDDDYLLERNKPTYNGQNLPLYLSEGFRNPLFIFAHAPEKSIPDSTSANTLVVNPGDNITQSKLNEYKTIWFAPGVHDLSRIGDYPFFQTEINRGQTFYLEGGSYVKARFRGNNQGEGKTSIVGRGVMSGIEHTWTRLYLKSSMIVQVDSISGITITDRAAFGIYGGHYIGDVAMIGAWHGNTMSVDYVDNCLIENCFFLSGDDNLKINHNTHARHCVIWQETNAHSNMEKYKIPIMTSNLMGLLK